MNIKVEIYGMFTRHMIKKRMSVKLHNDATIADLLHIIDRKMKLNQDAQEKSNCILLLNGRRLDPGDESRLREGDTISILSPIAGG